MMHPKLAPTVSGGPVYPGRGTRLLEPPPWLCLLAAATIVALSKVREAREVLSQPFRLQLAACAL